MTSVGQSQREQKGSQDPGPRQVCKPGFSSSLSPPQFLSRPSPVQYTSNLFSTSKIVSCHTAGFVGF